MHRPDMSRAARLAAHGAVATSLALCGEAGLRELLAAATPLGSGIGGKTLLLEVEGTPVFVKQVRLTDLERRPEHVHSTANLFGVPSCCQYGIGCGPGVSAWRELAVHTMTTNWVIAGAHEGFPLTYHWRVLTDSGRPLPDELADVEGTVGYWGGDAGVRRRITALQQSTASLTLFLEYIPHTLHDWLVAQFAAGDEAAGRACAMVDRELEAATSFMTTRGLLHFDAHFHNVLTDGRRLYFADYGLALSTRFDLTPGERGFHERHRGYDRSYTASYFVHWLVNALYGHPHGSPERHALVRAYAEGRHHPTGIPAPAAALLTRDASLSLTMWQFLHQLQHEDPRTPYPFDALRHTAPSANPL
ncbi:protein kinase family protein [Streptomyces sp. CA2R106]|uniref:protein kinase family protein n=1 Tax=Streptomyces sp. CA2R106 TaxID=3120153 RepID=UPI003009D38D